MMKYKNIVFLLAIIMLVVWFTSSIWPKISIDWRSFGAAFIGAIVALLLYSLVENLVKRNKKDK